MSSNSYGFECTIKINNREYFVLVIFAYTHEDLNYDSLGAFESKHGTTDAIELAKLEIKNRQLNKHNQILCVYNISGGWLKDDPNDITFNPPVPSDDLILKLIAENKAEDIVYDWDT